MFGAVTKIVKSFVLREKAMLDTIVSPLSNGIMEEQTIRLNLSNGVGLAKEVMTIFSCAFA